MPDWLSDDHIAVTWNTGEETNPINVYIVCINQKMFSKSDKEVTGSLIHEAVHVWQNHCRFLRDKNTSKEVEAYGIEAIATGLLNEFKRKKNKKIKSITVYNEDEIQKAKNLLGQATGNELENAMQQKNNNQCKL